MVNTMDRPITGSESGDEGRWQATLAREARFDGAFVYAVPCLSMPYFRLAFIAALRVQAESPDESRLPSSLFLR